MSREHSSETSRTGALAAVWMVARREIKARFFTKSNIISLAIMVTVIVAGVFVLDYFMNREDDGSADYVVAVESSVSELEPQLVAAGATQGTSIEVQQMARAEAETALSEDLDAFLAGEPGRPEMLVEGQADMQLLGMVTNAVQAHVLAVEISDLGGDPDAIGQSLADAVPQVASVDADEAGAFGPEYFLAVIAISLMLFALITTGSLIAMGVVEEKTSRVVEILLSTIRPGHLLAGKILGIGIVGMTQVVLLGGSAVLAMALTGLFEGFEIDLGSAMLMLVVWFLLGFAVYSLLFGGFAALISRQEEIGAVTTPIMLLLFVPFYVSMFMVSNDPSSPVVQVLSQVPFFSPFMMPVRDVYGGVELWEILLAIGIALATIPLLVWIAGRVYRRGVLHTGGRMKLMEALRG